MDEVFIETRRGFCPEFGDDNHPVTVTLKRTICIGGINFQPTITGAKCRNQQHCEYFEENNGCPLLNQFYR